MSLHRFTSEVQKKIVLDPRFGGIRAVYCRRIENKEGDEAEYKSVNLYVSPQGNDAASDNATGQIGIGMRTNVFWAKTEDLKFAGKPFLPEQGDVLKYNADGKEYRFQVALVSINGMTSTFAYEDGLHGIIKIMTVKMQ